MSKAHLTVNGFMLIDAPHSALNMLGKDPRAGNVVTVKVIQRERSYPYVSAQALRYWWRNTLATEKGWQLSPITRDEEKNLAFTNAQPWKYEDDDVFGYMRAQKIKVMKKNKKGQDKEDSKDMTLTRVSPLKCSPLVSVSPQYPTTDKANMSRHEGNPVLYDKQFYSTILKGIFSLDLTALGRFEQTSKTGFQNIREDGLTAAKDSGAIITDNVAVLSVEERRKRAEDTISVLPYLAGGANQTLNLTDVTPKLVILTVLRGGNHLFMNIIKDERGQAVLNIEALKEVLTAYGSRLETNVYIGRRKGFMDEQAGVLEQLSQEMQNVKVGELNEAVNTFVKEMVERIE